MTDPVRSPAARLGQLIEQYRRFAKEIDTRAPDARLRMTMWRRAADDLTDLLPAVQALEQEVKELKDRLEDAHYRAKERD